MVDARRVGDDEGRTLVGLGLGHGLDQLVHVRAHGDLRHVHIAVGHGHQAQILLAGALAGGRELGHGAGRRGLGSLSAGVGVDLGIEHEHVDVLALGQHMVQSAVADVVGPAVAAEDPDGLLGQQVGVSDNSLGQLARVAVAILALVGSAGQIDAVLAGRQQLGAGFLGTFSIVHLLQPLSARSLDVGGRPLNSYQSLNGLRQLVAAMADGQVHTKAELRVVLEQAVRPCRTVAFVIGGVGAGRSRTAVNGGAARGVGNDHAIAEQLGDQLYIRGLAAARARAGELEQRTQELAALNSLLVNLALEVRQRNRILPILLLGGLAGQRLHVQRLGLGGADLYAVAAAGAIQRAYLHTIQLAGKFLALGRNGLEGLGRGGSLLLGQQEGTDAAVRANQRAVAALYAVFGDPLGNLNSNAALLVLGRAGGYEALRVERGYGQLVALLLDDGLDNLVEVLGGGNFNGHSASGGGQPCLGHRNFLQAGDGDVDSVAVLLNYVVALLAVGLLDSGLHVLVRVLVGDNVGKLEESGLHDGVDAVAHANLRRQLDGVDGVELGVLLGQRLLHGSGQLGVQLLSSPGAVQQERAAVLEAVNHIIVRHVGRVVTGHEVSRIDQIRGLYRYLTETQVGYGQTARLLGVVGEVALSVHIGVVADDLDGVLVSANGTVGAQAVEHARDGAFRRGDDLLAQGQGGAGNVVLDTHGEVVLGRVLIQVVVHSLDHGGVELLGTQTVTTANNLDVGAAGLNQRGAYIQVQRLAQAAGLLGTIQNGQLLAGGGDRSHEVLYGERTVQVNLYQAQLLALLVEVVDGLLDGVAAGAHRDDDLLRVGSANVIEQMIMTAGQLAHLLHYFLNDFGGRVVVLVGGLTVLEVDVGVLSSALLMRMIGVHRGLAEVLDGLPVDQRLDLVIVIRLDLLNLVGGAEAVEEVQEGHAGLQRGQVGYQRHVHGFLYRVGGQHSKAGLTAGHNVTVVAENRQSVSGQRARAYVEHARHQLAGDLIHVRNHQQQALGRREGRRQRASRQRAVNRSAGFGLHLGDAHGLAEQVLAAVSRPFVRDFRHRRGGSYRVNRRHVRKRICNVANSGITVDSHLSQLEYPLNIFWQRQLTFTAFRHAKIKLAVQHVYYKIITPQLSSLTPCHSRKCRN